MTTSVIETLVDASGVVVIKMCEKVHKNAFSPALIRDLVDTFEWIGQRDDLKVVVVTGYDSYFLSGGTKDTLISLCDGEFKFTNSTLYSLPLFCRIPVIAAVQGHGIGGGLVFALFADVVVLSRESMYTMNFMKYGFTPGMGATSILPKKLGICLGEELLMGARTYRGADLQRRGVPFPVLPRTEVLPYACDLATEMAERPRLSLVLLKDHLVSGLREELPHTVRREVEMQEVTCRHPEVRGRINTLFGN